ncbi:MAG: FmdB family zinc ribbon protein [Dehalococcoidia bacterium]
MPIYEYHCSKCRSEFEQRRSIEERDASATCPACGDESRRLISAFASKTGYYLRSTGTAFRGPSRKDEVAHR